MMYSVVETEDLQKLISKLKYTKDLRTAYITGTAQRVKEGKTKAKIFTDTWPHFSAVVCQMLPPKPMLFCYATSDNALVDLINDIGLYHHRPKIGIVNCHVNRILQEFPELNIVFEGTVYHLPGPLIDKERLCPSGFVVGKLSPTQEHVEFVGSYWKYAKDGSEKTAWLKLLIESGHTCAVFKCDNMNTPVAWGLQYLQGEIGNVYTLPEYRYRGLASIVVREMCKLVIADGLTPIVMVEVGNPISEMFLKLGFVESGYRYNFVDF